MPPFKINIDLVKNSSLSLNSTSYKSSNVRAGLGSLHIDPQIAARRSIGSRLASARSTVTQLEVQLRELQAFLSNSAQRYNSAENAILHLINRGDQHTAATLPSNPCRAIDIWNQKEIKKEKDKENSSVINDILNFFDSINKSLSFTDAALIASHLFSVGTSLLFVRKLKITYIGGKPTFLQRLKGNYRFSVKADPSWTSRGRYSSKLARYLHDFSKANPSNSIVKQLHKFVSSYTSPSSILKHVAGFPKDAASMIDAKSFRSGFIKRVTTGTKDILEKAANAKGLTQLGRRMPIIAGAISLLANGAEYTDPKNSKKTLAEKTGRAAAGVISDFTAIWAGAELGAAIGGLAGPPGIVVGGAVGGFVGSWASSHYEKKVKQIGEQVGSFVDKGLKKVGNAFKSIGSWFN